MPDVMEGLRPTTSQSHQAGELTAALASQPDADLVTLRVPRELADLLRTLMPRLARGETISLVSVPEDLTTSTAAKMLGMSRPTLMKLVQAGAVASHKVGTHTRLRAEDVRAYRQKLTAERRSAYEELLAMDEEAGIHE